MKQVWFKKAGWVYVPVSVMGLIVTLAAIIFLVPIFSAIGRTGYSLSDNLYNIFAYTTCAVFWWKWIAEKTS